MGAVAMYSAVQFLSNLKLTPKTRGHGGCCSRKNNGVITIFLKNDTESDL